MTTPPDIVEEVCASLRRMLRDLARLPRSVRRAKASLPQPEDPVSLDRIVDSRARAADHAQRVAAHLDHAARDPHALALADLHALVEDIRGGLAAPRNLDDLGGMLAEASGRPGERAVRVLDRRVRRIGAEADRLFALAAAAQTQAAGSVALAAGSVGRPPTGAIDVVADAVREVGEVIAASLASAGADAAAGSPGRRGSAVADAIAGSLQAFGLPHSGARLPPLDAAAGGAPSSRPPASDDDAPLLRGSALVNATLLRTELDTVLALLDGLPDMLRFTPTQPGRLTVARQRVGKAAEDLLAAVSDPSRSDPGRAASALDRLSEEVLAALLGAVEASEPAHEGRATDARGATADLWVGLATLGALMTSMAGRVSGPSETRTSLAVATARLTASLSAARSAAAEFEAELTRFGARIPEQPVTWTADKAGETSDTEADAKGPDRTIGPSNSGR